MSVRLNVPYVSQLVAGSGGNNCGPACMAMCLAYRGVIAPTQEAMLECADIARDGLSDNLGETGGYVTFTQLANVAGWYGQRVEWYSTWADVDASLDAREPVILLVDNTVLLPRQYPVTPAFNAHHFILLTGYDYLARSRPSSDPLSVYVGGPSVYLEDSVRRGAAAVGGVQAMALRPLESPATPTPMPPEVVMLLEDWEIKNWVLADLYNMAGIDYNADSGTAQAWVNALRGGTYLGRPRTPERPYGEGTEAGVWVEFEYGVMLFRLRDGAASWTG